MSSIDILAISGSLRKRSSNAELLHAAARLASVPARVLFEPGVESLPPFNPDLDQEGMDAPAAVQAFRARIGAADALVISSPEYAHGVPGVLKNALDWLVSAPEIVHKPIGLFNASPRATHAQASLAETLRTMSTEVVPAASISVPVSERRLDAEAIVADRELAGTVRRALEALVQAVEARRRRGSRRFRTKSDGAL